MKKRRHTEVEHSMGTVSASRRKVVDSAVWALTVRNTLGTRGF